MLPWADARISPIHLVLKDNGDWRLLHDLSFGEDSVNSLIADSDSSVEYVAFDTLVDHVEALGRGKSDLQMGYLLRVQAHSNCSSSDPLARNGIRGIVLL